ncbi:MAG TPA: HAMP domain-containing sensor histidine kinase [Candidatus Limnocylindrales bacterium]|nr:HAMP domain-containing sensor histidine kinase [Candidatus Limnocylindrales bacterium]
MTRSVQNTALAADRLSGKARSCQRAAEIVSIAPFFLVRSLGLAQISCVLSDFLISHRDVIIDSIRTRVASRESPKPTEREMEGIPVFLDQLGEALRLAALSDVIDHDEIAKSAARHGHELLRRGLTIGQVVHDYGDVCQSVTELAVDSGTTISSSDFRTLNLCLDDAIAGAVTEFAKQRELEIAGQENERLGVLAHELRNHLNTAMLAFEAIRDGHVAPGGSTGQVLGRALTDLNLLLGRSLAHVRLDAGIMQHERIPVADLLEEIATGSSMVARARGVKFSVSEVAAAVAIEGDRQILSAALTNLLQNAFKFTHKNSRVSLTTTVTSRRVVFEVEDECGGLPVGKAADLFLPFQQIGPDRSGLGLGLSICMRAVTMSGGELRVRDLPGKGCVFTLDLPRAGVPVEN